MDEAGANKKGLSDMYGEEALKRVKSCEFHFKGCRNRQRNKLPDEERETFTDLTDSLLLSQSIANYNKALGKCCSSCRQKHHRLVLKPWLDWWHKRKDHIFRAWCDPNGPSTNLAKIGHSLWAKKMRTTSHLCEAKEDIAECILKYIASITMWKHNTPKDLYALCGMLGESQRCALMKFCHVMSLCAARTPPPRPYASLFSLSPLPMPDG